MRAAPVAANFWSEVHLNEDDGERDDALNDELEDEIDFELDDELDLEDRVGSVEQSHDGNEIVLSWSRRGANEGTEMLRFDEDANCCGSSQRSGEA
jgi:hypothetical protein